MRPHRDGDFWQERITRRVKVSGIESAMVHAPPNHFTFSVRVHPRAKRNAITGMVGDAYKLSLTAPPVDRRANAACIEFFAKLFAVPRSSVTIAAGETRRNKVIRIAGVSAERAIKSLTAFPPGQ